MEKENTANNIENLLKKDENSVIKKKGFLSSFFALFKNIDPISNNQISEDKETFNYFNQCLANNSYQLCTDFINKGYNATNSQYASYKKLLITQLHKNRNFIEENYKKHEEVPNFLAKAWLYQYYSNDYVTPLVSEKLKKFDFAYSIFKELNESIVKKINNTLNQLRFHCTILGLLNGSSTEDKNRSLIYRIYNQFNMIDKILSKHIDNELITIEILEDYKNNLKIGYYHMKLFNDKIKPYDNSVKASNFSALHFKRYNYYIDELEKLITLKLKKNHDLMISKFNHNDLNSKTKESAEKNITMLEETVSLPEEASSILKNIKYKYAIVKDSTKGIIDMSLIHLDLLCEKKTVTIVQTYSSMNDYYKTNLFDKNGQNAQDLMIDSLKEIEKSLDEKLLEFNQDKLKELSISNQVIKNKP